jgi:hypothetical protein
MQGNQCNPPATTEYDPDGHSKQVEAPPFTAETEGEGEALALVGER